MSLFLASLVSFCLFRATVLIESPLVPVFPIRVRRWAGYGLVIPQGSQLPVHGFGVGSTVYTVRACIAQADHSLGFPLPAKPWVGFTP